MNEALAISEAAARAGLTVHAMRYYEGEGLLPRVSRAESGHRRFSENDVIWAVFITRLRSTGMSIRKIREYVDLYRQGPSTERARLALLEEHRDEVRERMSEMERSLALIEVKIEAYRSTLTPPLPAG